MKIEDMTINPPWLADFYDPALFDASAGDADTAATIVHYHDQLSGAPRHVLDIGCGTGRLAFPLLDDGHRVHGLDISTKMLAYFEARAGHLRGELRARLTWQSGSILDVPPIDEFDVLVAADDFVTHFDLAELARFFAAARHWLRPGGVLLTDMRERSAARLEAAAAPFPKPVQSHGLAGGILTEQGERYAAMMGWEEYDYDSRWLISHQLYSFISADGREEKRDWKTIRQRNHSNAEFIEAAGQAGFMIEQALGRREARVGEQGGFFRLVRR